MAHGTVLDGGFFAASLRQTMSFRAEENLTCPVCQDIFNEPVILTCSHSFCRDCVQTWWRGKPSHECPVCKEKTLLSDPPRNLALKNLCESFLLERDSKRSESVCGLHGEKLKLFCLDHQQPVCVVCLHSETHKDHGFRPVDEVAQNRRDELQRHLTPLQGKLTLCQRVRANCEQTAEHVEVQARRTEGEMKRQFEKLHRFLREEEEARIGALREEEELKSRTMKEKTEALGREIAALSHAVRAAEEELRAEDVSFLLNYPAAEERLREVVSYAPVILDPNTANPELAVSEDLTGVTHGERQKLPENPERIDYHRSVLGSEGFDSGTRSWEVEVGDSASWFLGVAAESVQRKGHIHSGIWRLGLSNGQYKACSPSAPAVVLTAKGRRSSGGSEFIWTGTEGTCRSTTSTPTRTYTPSRTRSRRSCSLTSATATNFQLGF
uniref:Tripartite motif-containing protein 35-like n=1 Tax=Scophthalmus maximus TaxID=52904 RepID=A0A8D2ZKB6_SCOMX